MSVKFIAYNEPIFEDTIMVRTRTHGITMEEAISRQKQAAELKKFKYSCDEEALFDFISINWAWFVEIP